MKHAKAIQICGTGSGVGKSVIACALCRIFTEDGYTVAPFKSQNMALNSFVTDEGLEIARAQATQALACRARPTADMNPVLIKPTAERMAQIIVQGRPKKNMSVYEYKKFKGMIFGKIKQSLMRLKKDHQIIVIEGAGSPAEVNLMSHDLANIKIASLAGAKVILVGDIDKGGVFAWLIGTLQLLDKEERSRIAGIVINKFRGDKRLLRPGITFLEKYTGIKVLGVIPYFKDIKVPEEDCVPPKAPCQYPARGSIKISVIYLPHISNFTDFDAFNDEPDVCLNYVKSPDELDNPDVIIIPGSKNTIDDLFHLKRCGLAEKIVSIFLRDSNVTLVGICGGYQMLGTLISDTKSIESSRGSIAGLGILPVVTEMHPKKVLSQVKARHISSGEDVFGYFIHHGQSRISGDFRPLFEINGNQPRRLKKYDGVESADGRCWGTYMHGVFDSDKFRREFLNAVRKRVRLPVMENSVKFDIDGEISKLARLVRRNIDLKRVYKILNYEDKQ